MLRIGQGYDVHQLVENRTLIMGGETIKFHLGLLGHSDADVLIHAIMDALLGALSLGDIGKHFPDTDERYKGISSIKLLEHVQMLLENENAKVNNIDAIIVAQQPKIKPYISKMQENIAKVLKLDISQVSIKATTEEYLGFTGNLSGIKSYAVALIERP